MMTITTQAREFVPTNTSASPFVPPSSGLKTSGKPFVPSFDAKPFIPSNAKALSLPLAPTSAQPTFYNPSMAQGLYKTEICKNWIENGYCRYGKKCQYAHGSKQLVAPVFTPAPADLSTGQSVAPQAQLRTDKYKS